MGSHVSIRAMAAESGRNKSSIERWAKADNWEDKRSQFSSSLRTEVRQKTIEKASDKLSDDYADIAVSNYKAHKIERDMAHATLQVYAKAIAQIQSLPLDEQLKRLKELSGYEINYWSLVLARATQGVNAATGLSNYVQLDSAAKVLIAKGYEIVDPNDTEAEESQDSGSDS